ncbi:MAG: hypothetical protein IJS52_02880 [Bacilli bacterium]|nr:hypothetical protein [Bacilli bacterium]
MNEELLKGLSQEQLEKARACRSYEELLQAAKEEGLQLNEDQLEAVDGGGCDNEQSPSNTDPNGPRCPRCGSTNVTEIHDSDESRGTEYRCNNCGAIWA